LRRFLVRPHGIQRRLAALFSADVKGYSRLMGEDEVATVRTLIAYREVMTARILEHGGRVVDCPGDNLLAEFASVVDAVQCAVDIQQELTTRNAALPLHRRMEFRIGINLGDVLVEDERLYGDGVNITARIEALAEAGGICLSGTAYDQVETKFALSYEYLGEHTVKNIAKPVRVYRVLREGDVPRSPQLIDATTGHHLWAERYDRALTDIFGLQDEIIRQIVLALQVQLTEGEQARVWYHATESLDAYELFLRGRALAMHKTPETHAQARQLFEQAIALDPQFAVAYVHLGWLHQIEARFRWSPAPAASLQQAQALAQKALALDTALPDAYALLGAISLLQGQHAQALAEGEKALALNPNGADIAVLFAATLNLSGRPRDSSRRDICCRSRDRPSEESSRPASPCCRAGPTPPSLLPRSIALLRVRVLRPAACSPSSAAIASLAS
jgi:class 3 adenylate cyclase